MSLFTWSDLVLNRRQMLQASACGFANLALARLLSAARGQLVAANPLAPRAPPFPAALGSCTTYGLGTQNQTLPGFITICPTLTHGGVNNYASAFLPAVYHGTSIGTAATPSERATIPFIQGPTPRGVQRLELD